MTAKGFLEEALGQEIGEIKVLAIETQTILDAMYNYGWQERHIGQSEGDPYFDYDEC